MKKIRIALFNSVIALVLCLSMLAGTTYAWFTDQETSANNKIIAGNLDIALYHQGAKDDTMIKVDANTDDLFDDVLPTRWEPGAMAIETFKVANEGNLALKYEFTMNIAGTTYAAMGNTTRKFTDLLKIAVVDGQIPADARIDTAAYNWQSFETFVKPGELVIDVTTNVGESDVFTVIVWWEPSDIDNYFNMNDGADSEMSADFNIKLLATQYNAENDAFDDLYDENAEYPLVDIGFINDTMNEVTLEAKEVSVSVPAGSPAGAYKLSVDSKAVTTDDVDNTTTIAYEIKLTKDDVAVSGGEYFVTIDVEPMLNIAKVTHNDVEITDYVYDAFTGVITFTTTSFSPFAITYTELDVSDVEINEDEEGNKFITGGVFVGVNPATIDETLAEADSEYIAVNYTVDGEVCYVVSKRSETVICASGDASDYTAVNGNYTVTNNVNGKLYSIISALQNNEHSTVYLLPGTYNEATTIYVYSSMDIIGLGDKDSVKVIKQSSSDSNRHLFNATGTKADYIEVTLRNMYLDATANTSGGKDNAAVQSIRKSKVKCYDLTIVKNPTNMSSIALYVNGNNAVDGVKYPAYLYVENCELNTTKTFCIISTAGTYKFFHSGLTYNNGTAYTANSGSTKNQTMEPNDWEWD